jgi:hypothetical protein
VLSVTTATVGIAPSLPTPGSAGNDVHQLGRPHDDTPRLHTTERRRDRRIGQRRSLQVVLGDLRVDLEPAL